MNELDVRSRIRLRHRLIQEVSLHCRPLQFSPCDYVDKYFGDLNDSRKRKFAEEWLKNRLYERLFSPPISLSPDNQVRPLIKLKPKFKFKSK